MKALDQFQRENHGPDACLTAARYAVAHPDEVVTLELHSYNGNLWQIVGTLQFGLTSLETDPGSVERTIRWVGERGTLHGAGSHGLISTWDFDDDAAIRTAIRLAAEAARQNAEPVWSLKRYPPPPADHNRDADCDVDPETLACRGCGVAHGDSCPKCDGRGYHEETCSIID